MGSWDFKGFRPERLTERPDGFPDRGYEFEVQYEPSLMTGEQCRTVYLHHVYGWEKQIDNEGNVRVSVRAHPIAVRKRNVVGSQMCNMGHLHWLWDGDEPKNANPSFCWGFGDETEAERAYIKSIDRR